MTIISLDAYRARRAGAPVTILSQHRPAPVPGADVRLPDGRVAQYVCQTLGGRHFLASEGATISVAPDAVWIADDGDGPEAAA